MRTVFYLLMCIFLSGCTGSKPNPDFITDKITGKQYSTDEWAALDVKEKEEIREGNKELVEDETFTDRLLSEPILIIYAVGTIIFIILAVVCLYMSKANPRMLWGAVASGAGAVTCIAAPVLTIMFLQAAKIILYGLVGLVAVCSIIVIFWLWRCLNSSKVANKGLVGSVGLVLGKLDPETKKSAVAELKVLQDDKTRKAADKILESVK